MRTGLTSTSTLVGGEGEMRLDTPGEQGDVDSGSVMASERRRGECAEGWGRGWEEEVK